MIITLQVFKKQFTKSGHDTVEFVRKIKSSSSNILIALNIDSDLDDFNKLEKLLGDDPGSDVDFAHCLTYSASRDVLLYLLSEGFQIIVLW